MSMSRGRKNSAAALPPCYEDEKIPDEQDVLHDNTTLGVLRCRGCHRVVCAELAFSRRRRWPGAENLTEVCVDRHFASNPNSPEGLSVLRCAHCQHVHYQYPPSMGLAAGTEFATQPPWVAVEIAGEPLFARSPYRILVCSLDEDECEKTKQALEQGLLSIENQSTQRAVVVLSLILDHSNLRDFKFQSNITEGGIDLVVLIHYAEGRTLLTDADGLYNNFLYKACEISGGNIFIALAGIETEESDLSNDEAVQDLVGNGGQSSVVDINLSMRFMSWDEAPSEMQLYHLKKGIDFEIEPLVLPQGIRQYAVSISRTTRFFCLIL